MKTLFKVVSGLLVVLVIAVAAAFITFDPNDYKTQLTAVVEKHTGRTLTIDGKISLSVFPWIGVEVGRLSLSNAKGFSQAEFARSEQLDVKVKLLPLLVGNIEIDKIRLHGLFASLETHKDGTSNWQDMAGTAETKIEAADKTASTESAASYQLTGFMVNGIELVAANVQWLDDQSGMHARISDLNFESGAIKFDQWVAIKLSTHVSSTQPEIDAKIKLDTDVKINQALNLFDLRDFTLDLSTLMKSLAAERIDLTMKMDASANLVEQKVELSKLNISTPGASLDAQLTVSNLDKQPLVAGTLSSTNIKPRELAKTFGVALPDSRDSWALTALSFNSSVQASAEFAKFDKLVLTLDKSKLNGFVHVNNIATPAISYQLALDTIDVDAYLPAPVEAAAAPAPVAGPSEDVVIDLPLEFLRKLELAGEMKIGSLRVKEIDISDMQIKTSAANGIVKLDPVSMKLLEGTFVSAVTLDARSTPAYTLTAKASDVKPAQVVNPLLVGLLGNEELALEGILQMSADIKTRGGTLNTLKQAATGPVNITMGRTTVTGVDIMYYLRNVVAGYAEGKKIAVKEGFRGSYTPKEKTAFDKVIVSSRLADGKINNEQLLMDSRRIKVNGSGVIDILNNTLDEKITVQLDAGSEQTVAEKILQKPVGVRVHGPFAQPVTDVDYASLGKAIASMLTGDAQTKAQEKTDAMKTESQAKLDAERQKLKAQEEAKKAEAEQKLKDKANDKLKGLFR